MSEAASVASSNFAPYDQYEVSIPMEIAGDCLHTVSALSSSTCICQHTALCEMMWDVKWTASVFSNLHHAVLYMFTCRCHYLHREARSMLPCHVLPLCIHYHASRYSDVNQLLDNHLIRICLLFGHHLTAAWWPGAE